MSKRRTELDYCRIVACVMIVMLHTAAKGWYISPDSFEWGVYNFYDMIVRGAVPVFFMISGALFLDRETLDIKKLFKKNIFHLMIVYVFWSVLYAISDLLLNNTEFSFYSFALQVVKGHYHMWFLVAMITAYLFLPVVHGAIHGRKVPLGYFAALFAVYSLLVSNLRLIPDCPEIIIAFCNQIAVSQIQYLGYMALGYYLSRKSWGGHWKITCPVTFFVVGFVAALANQWYSIRMGEPTQWLYGHFSVPSFVLALCIFIFFQCFRGREFQRPEWIASLSVSTLGVYLLHPLLLEFCKSIGVDISKFPPLVSVPVAVFLLVVACFCLITVLRRIPILRICIE